MRLRLVAALALCSCNQFYGIEVTGQTPLIDAQYFDAPIDAPFACPPLSAPPPVYSRTLRQIPQDCYDLTLSTNTAMATATCNEPMKHVAEGPINDLLAPIPGLMSMVGTGADYNSPRLAPEGDTLFVMKKDGTGSIERRTRTGTTWSPPVALTPSVALAAVLGTPTRGPIRRMMTRNISSGVEIAEIEIGANGTWSMVAQYSYFELGASYILLAPSLSPDGLRAVWSAEDAFTFNEKAFYATRPNLGARFGTPSVLQGVPSALGTFMTEDCGHVYFSAAASILYVQQM